MHAVPSPDWYGPMWFFRSFGRWCVAVLLVSGAAWTPAAAQAQRASYAPDDDNAGEVAARYPDESILSDTFVQKEGRRGLEMLYNMEFEEAGAIFDTISRRYPDHPIAPFLKGLNIWWNHIMLNLPSTAHDDAFFEAMDEVIARCEALLDEDPDHLDALFLRGAALGFRARLHSNRENWLKAVMDGRRAIGDVREVGQLAPDNPDYVFGKGMYDYYAAIIPENYSFGKAIMFFLPEGNRTEGLEQLEQAAQHGRFIQTEAVYFLLQIHYLYEKDFAKSREYVMWLREQHPDNPYFHSYEGRVYARWGRWREAARIYESVLERYQEEAPGYNAFFAQQALYFIARDRMRADAYEEALRYLVQLEALSAGAADDDPYRAMGRLQQGMVYDALGKRAAAEQRYRQVLEMNDVNGSHERAERYLETPYEG